MANDPIQQSKEFNAEHRIEENIAYGYRDGGRRVNFDDNGNPAVQPNREIIIVKSPREDKSLAQAIETAKMEMAQMTSIEEKARYLNKYVGKLLRQEDPDINESIMHRMSGGDFVGKEISLGQLIDAETGVCRHRSLLFKVIADETGIPTALVRGNYYELGRGGGHAWNEVKLENGDRILVDVMHDFVGSMGHPKVRNYAYVDDRPMYEAARPAPNISFAQKQIADDIAGRMNLRPDAVRFYDDGSIGVIVNGTYSRGELIDRLGMNMDLNDLDRRNSPASRNDVEILIRKDQIPGHYASVLNDPARQGPAPRPNISQNTPDNLLGGIKKLFNNAADRVAESVDAAANNVKNIFANEEPAAPKPPPQKPQGTPAGGDFAQHAMNRLGMTENAIRRYNDGSVGILVDSRVSRNQLASELGLNVAPDSLHRKDSGRAGYHEVIVRSDQIPASFNNVAPRAEHRPEPAAPKPPPQKPQGTPAGGDFAQHAMNRLGMTENAIRRYNDGSVGILVDSRVSRNQLASELGLNVAPDSLHRKDSGRAGYHEVIVRSDQIPASFNNVAPRAEHRPEPAAPIKASRSDRFDAAEIIRRTDWKHTVYDGKEARFDVPIDSMASNKLNETINALKIAGISYEVRDGSLSIGVSEAFDKVAQLEAAAGDGMWAKIKSGFESAIEKGAGQKTGFMVGAGVGLLVAGMAFSEGASAAEATQKGVEAVSVTAEVGGRLSEGNTEAAEKAAAIGYTANAASIGGGAVALQVARAAGMGIVSTGAAALTGGLAAGILVGVAAEKLWDLHEKGNMAHLKGGKLDTAQEVRDVQRSILNDPSLGLPKNIVINGDETTLEQALQHHPKKVMEQLKETHPQAMQALGQWQELEGWRQKFLMNQIPPGTSVPFFRIDDAKDVQAVQEALLTDPDLGLPQTVRVDGKEISIAEAVADHPEKLKEAFKDSPEILDAIAQWEELEEVRRQYLTGQIENGTEAKISQQAESSYVKAAQVSAPPVPP